MSISASDTRGFIFGDDDEIDFKSDTMYDSLRTVASSCVRATETPLDSVYDESPPSTAGNGKTKRMSVQEILGRVWDDDDRIVEEDENEVTIIRATDDDKMPFPMHTTLTVPRLSPNSSRDNLSSAANDIGRFCLDDELDEDWGDGDVHPSPLSPPSKSSSLNSRGLGSQLRLALTDESSDELEIAGPPEVHRESRGGRRLSSLFDWIETPVLDKGDMDGPYPRSKSALGKQETDTRGGRTSLRKGPTPAHIRSQSVPITQDGDSNAKPSSAKYGTWGLGTRPVSEDWDEDFDFDGGDDENEGGGGGGGSGSDEPLGRSSSFLVPESIRASQPSVKAHSGQIRELSLLVNDLKRLCRHGRDMDMLKGPRRDLWEEAEGVIALASPDEEDDDDEESASRGSKPTDGESDAAETAVPCLGRFDGGALENRNLEPAMSKTAVVRERHSPKRRSVFSPDDDIFGSANWPLTDDNNDSSSGSGDAIAQPGRVGRPRTPVIQIDAMNDAAGATRSVMEAMSRSLPRHRSPGVRYDKKVHFDTNSLRVLVRRAGELRDSLSDLVRHAENLTHTPCKAPRHERHAESSPAFTKVFDDPNASPQPVLTRSGGPDSAGDAPPSPRKSSSSPMGTHLQPMIVK
ncbi:hypothetical protein ESCO_003815 [Escovopsis weberi]|uniref:Uncharacterized protein n=1 Tax=Escovopsis weberi TaxID=150374 RepID=A0A0M8N9B6_ESCWE|nr:hypothetical protein ESCO_003815 [Escovopsis weberi]